MLTAPATKGQRAGAYLIDVIPGIVIAVLFGWVPIIGAMVAGFCLMLYWLFRDVTGASLGKLALGLRVSGPDGLPASVSRRILRNVPFAIGPALLIIPILGYALAPPISLIIGVVEIIMVLTQGSRVGDRLAGTVVMAQQAAGAYQTTA